MIRDEDDTEGGIVDNKRDPGLTRDQNDIGVIVVNSGSALRSDQWSIVV